MFYLRDRFYTVTTKVRDLPEEKTLTSNLLPERDEVFSFFRWQQKASGNGTVRKRKGGNMIQQYEMEPGIVQTIQWKRSGR